LDYYRCAHIEQGDASVLGVSFEGIRTRNDLEPVPSMAGLKDEGDDYRRG
jgi:hypothetical protein